MRPAKTEKRFHLFTPKRKASFDSNTSPIEAVKYDFDARRRPLSTIDTHSWDPAGTGDDDTSESGIFFGIGLFSLIFSLLPPKGKGSV